MNHTDFPLASIVINNYNYEAYVEAAINSALNQTYPNVEVVVIDDGSTDKSKDIILSYGQRINTLFKENGGQASSLNSGIEKSSGEIICLLDADDIFLPCKVEMVVKLLFRLDWKNNDILLNNFLEIVDQDELPVEVDLVDEILSGPGDWSFLKALTGTPLFFDGQLNKVSNPDQAHKFADKYRFLPYLGVQTSGITMTKSLANKVFPLPHQKIRVSADVFLVKAASLSGAIYSTNLTLSKYRVHGSNNWYGSKSRKEFNETEKFFLQLNDYLNVKLNEMGKRPAFSYMDSMSAKGYYRYYFGYHSYRNLFELSFKVLLWHRDALTVRFFIKTILLSIYLKVRLQFQS